MSDWELVFKSDDSVWFTRTGYKGAMKGAQLPSDMVAEIPEDVMTRYITLTLLPVPKSWWESSVVEGMGEVRNPDGKELQHCVYIDKETAHTIRDELKRRKLW